MFQSSDSSSIEFKADSVRPNEEGGWEHEVVSGVWSKTEFPAQAEPYRNGSAEFRTQPFQSGDAEFENAPLEISNGNDVSFSNGDQFSISPGGRWTLTDADGNKVEKLERIDKGQIAGSSTYRLSNGAEYHSGCFTDSIRYPNGEIISFLRSGQIVSENLFENNQAEGESEEIDAEPKSKNDGETREFTMTNGDIVDLGPNTFNWTDKDGNKVRAVNIIVDNGIPGHTNFEMANGAIYHAGCAAESISYPNGDALSFYRSGDVISANIGGISFK